MMWLRRWTVAFNPPVTSFCCFCYSEVQPQLFSLESLASPLTPIHPCIPIALPTFWLLSLSLYFSHWGSLLWTSTEQFYSYVTVIFLNISFPWIVFTWDASEFLKNEGLLHMSFSTLLFEVKLVIQVPAPSSPLQWWVSENSLSLSKDCCCSSFSFYCVIVFYFLHDFFRSSFLLVWPLNIFLYSTLWMTSSLRPWPYLPTLYLLS